MRERVKRLIFMFSYETLTRALCEKCPNTEFFLVFIFPHSVSLCIQSEYRKIRTRKNSVFGHFSRSGVNAGVVSKRFLSKLEEHLR